MDHFIPKTQMIENVHNTTNMLLLDYNQKQKYNVIIKKTPEILNWVGFKKKWG